MTDRQQEVRDFLETTVKEKGFSLNSLSLQLGKNSTYLFHFVKRHSPRRLDEQSRRKLSEILAVPEQKLCDYPLSNGIIGGGLIQDKLTTISDLLGWGKDKSQLPTIEVIDMEGHNKGSFNKVRGNKAGVEYISPEMMETYGIEDSRDVKIIKNIGDAMSPTITASDMIWVDTSYRKPANDGIYLLNTPNNTIIRRLQINPFDNSLEISADNPAYKAFNVKNADDIDIVGKVLWVVHRL